MEATNRQSERRVHDKGRMEPEFGPTCGPQHEDRQVLPINMLLVLKVLVSRDKEIEPSALRGSEQCTVLQARPPALVRSLDARGPERSPQRRWRALIEADVQGALRGNS